MARQTMNLGDFTGTGAGTGVPVDADLSRATVSIYGTFVGTMTLQVSHDGTNWVAARNRAGTAISSTTPTSFGFAGDASFVRGNCTVYTSGTISVRVMAPN